MAYCIVNPGIIADENLFHDYEEKKQCLRTIIFVCDLIVDAECGFMLDIWKMKNRYLRFIMLSLISSCTTMIWSSSHNFFQNQWFRKPNISQNNRRAFPNYRPNRIPSSPFQSEYMPIPDNLVFGNHFLTYYSSWSSDWIFIVFMFKQSNLRRCPVAVVVYSTARLSVSLT